MVFCGDEESTVLTLMNLPLFADLFFGSTKMGRATLKLIEWLEH
jgi:hypothetical protein